MTDAKPRAVTPEPGPRQKNPTAAMIGYRQHRAAGEPIGGTHGDRQQTGRASGRAAALASAAADMHDGRPHDYRRRDTGTPLPAWFYVLYEQPVPDDAPRTPPPEGFARVLRKRRELAARRAEASGAMCVGPGSGDDPARTVELVTGDAAAPPEAVTVHPPVAEAAAWPPEPGAATSQPATVQPATQPPATEPPRPARRCRRGCGYPSGSRGCKTTHGED